jgi:Peptidase A4 family
MKRQSRKTRRLWLEELEGRVVPSASSILSTSTNWSGYAVSAPSGSVSFVSGSWTVSKVTGTGPAYSVAWVGIDGYTSSSVEQIGTEADIVNGKAVYSAWYEMYPQPSVTISSLTINPGDSITASVTASGSTFTLRITDSTTNKAFTTNQSAPSAQKSSAEWIEEAPSSNNVLPLANFGTETFSNAKATIESKSGPIDNTSWTNTQVNEINMVSGRNQTETSTTALADSGTTSSSFSVKFAATTTPTPVPPPPPPPPVTGHHHHHGWGWWWFSPNMTVAPSQTNPAVALLNSYGQTTQPSYALPTSVASTPALTTFAAPTPQPSIIPASNILLGAGQDARTTDDDTDDPSSADASPNVDLAVVHRSTGVRETATIRQTQETPARIWDSAVARQRVTDACFMALFSEQSASLDVPPTPTPQTHEVATLDEVGGIVLALALPGSAGLVDENVSRRDRMKRRPRQ